MLFQILSITASRWRHQGYLLTSSDFKNSMMKQHKLNLPFPATPVICTFKFVNLKLEIHHTVISTICHSDLQRRCYVVWAHNLLRFAEFDLYYHVNRDNRLY
ncbi:hypothetical protein T4A_14361 [Trichinella pseudospiralis]|uniref:Uncharacterized protein n=1 Tax=Trichinella pseudospiralis TaxID=6337 RepID=A0A0V1DU19_TRIPS|nr:hypothetical protein T4A_14361 [Trichinella pseudospiralis]